MDDKDIINLYFQRDESAIAETSNKYGGYLSALAFNILDNREDTAECVNDTYFRAWNVIPPQMPRRLKCFLGRIARNLALNMAEAGNALKRGKGRIGEALDELEECIPSKENVENAIEEKALTELLDGFLGGLPKRSRIVFVRKYWYMDSVKEISALTGLSESGVKSLLLRTRKKLKKELEKEGVIL